MKMASAQGLTTENDFVSSRLRSRRQSQVSDGRLRRERDLINNFASLQRQTRCK